MKLLTLARDLRRRKARERERQFVAEGVRAVEELAKSSLDIEGVLVAPQLILAPRGEALLNTLRARGVAITEVTARDFATAAQTESPQGVLAVGLVPDRSLRDLIGDGTARLLILDAIQDPGNVGTILRTAAALGVDATVALPGTVDVWNAKVVRSAMGAQFHHPALWSTWSDLADFLRDHALPLWGADASGEHLGALEAPARLALAVGNEGGGLTDETRQYVSHLVAIPIGGAVESLNVAVATGILLYELAP